MKPIDHWVLSLHENEYKSHRTREVNYKKIEFEVIIKNKGNLLSE